MIDDPKTRAEQLLEQRQNLPPELSNRMVRGVTEARREKMHDELDKGLFREKGSKGFSPKDDYNKQTPAGFATFSSSKRVAKFGSGEFGVTSSGGGWRGPNDTVRQLPEVYSPLWLNSNLNLPRDRATINAWSRSFFALNPIVHNAITLHSTYPIAKLNIKCKNPKYEKFFSQMAEEIDLMNICCQVAQEYWVLGEAFPYAELNEAKGKWSRIIILNPDYVNVQRSVIAAEPIISLRADENLKRVVFGNKPSDVQQKKQLDPSIIEHVRRNENIPLNNFYIHHLARKIAPYEVRGTGLIVSCFRSLMLWDKFKESKFSQSESMVNPLTLVKIGDAEYRPTPTDLDHWRNIFEESSLDRNFRIFTHNAVTVERVGYGQGIYDISTDVTQLIKETYIGLMVPSVIMDGSDTTYATGSVALDVLRQRYMQFRNYMASWLKTKIFAPISQINDFYDYEDGEKVLVVPEVDWNHMSLFDMDTYINQLVQLSAGEGNQKRISVQTMYRSLGLTYEEEQRKIRYEAIQDAIKMREIAAIARYPLHELKSLSPTDEIEEIVSEPVPGQSPYVPGAGGAPGAPGGGPPGGGAGLGGMPGAPPPSPIGGGGPPGP